MNTNQAWNKGSSAANSGKGPSNMSSKPTPVRQSYTAGYNAAKAAQNSKKK